MGFVLTASLLPAQQVAAQTACTFTLGFKALRDQIPDTVGNCLENERFNPENGNAEQKTAGGLLVWRKTDNWTVFTNGSLTWLNGPCGLESRPNAGPPLPWEGQPGAPCSPIAAAPLPAPAPEQGVRIPGELRIISMADQPACYRLGQLDSAQDRAAGVPLKLVQIPSPAGAGNGYIYALQEGFSGVAWVESSRVVAQVRVERGGRDWLLCAQAYLDGYRGVPFRPYTN